MFVNVSLRERGKDFNEERIYRIIYFISNFKLDVEFIGIICIMFFYREIMFF